MKNDIGKHQPYTVKRLAPEQINDACRLVIEVFSRFEAPEYSAKGIASFHSFLSDREKLCKMPFYGAFSKDELVGVLAMREPQHISLFFVK